LAESCLRYGLGTRVTVPDGIDPFVFLFAESQARAIVAVPLSATEQFSDLCAAYSYPCQVIGVVVDGAGAPVLEVHEQFSVPLAELRDAFVSTLPALFSASPG
jgi:phosphoribosylformylglycinamidine (FGAM) synthase-like enzyme